MDGLTKIKPILKLSLLPGNIVKNVQKKLSVDFDKQKPSDAKTKKQLEAERKNAENLKPIRKKS